MALGVWLVHVHASGVGSYSIVMLDDTLVGQSVLAKEGDVASSLVSVGHSWSYMVEGGGDNEVDVVRPDDVSATVGTTCGGSGGVGVRDYHCVIVGVGAGGWVDRWNRKYPGCSVGAGGPVIQVNGVRGSTGMRAHFSKRKEFWTWVCKPSVPTQSAIERPAVPEPSRSSDDISRSCHLQLKGSPHIGRVPQGVAIQVDMGQGVAVQVATWVPSGSSVSGGYVDQSALIARSPEIHRVPPKDGFGSGPSVGSDESRYGSEINSDMECEYQNVGVYDKFGVNGNVSEGGFVVERASLT